MKIGEITIDDWHARNIDGLILLERKQNTFTKIALIEPIGEHTCSPIFMGNLRYLNDIYDKYSNNRRFNSLEEAKIYLDVFLEKASKYILFT